MWVGQVFCNERDGMQNYFGRQEFEFELAKRAHVRDRVGYGEPWWSTTVDPKLRPRIQRIAGWVGP